MGLTSRRLSRSLHSSALIIGVKIIEKIVLWKGVHPALKTV
jgi:hypothetical protein